jgi:phospholipid transport system transporter-binding protein
MKIASAKQGARPKAAAAPKPRSRTAKSAAATIKGPLAATAALRGAAEVAFDEAATVVVATLLPVAVGVTPLAAVKQQAAEEVCDEAYVDQLLAASAALDTSSVAATAAVESIDESTQELIETNTVVIAEASAAHTTVLEVLAPEPISAITTATAAAVVAANSSGTVLLPPQCLTRDAAQLKQQLLPHVNDTAVSIDTHQIERIDSAAMQVLLAFVRDRRSQQRAINWLGLNEVFVDSAQVLGLEQLLGLPVSGAAA